MAKQEMTWSNDRDAYVGEWSDGREFEVDGSCWSESVQDGVKEVLKAHPEMSEDDARDEVEAEMLDPLTWTDDMFGVSVK